MERDLKFEKWCVEVHEQLLKSYKEDKGEVVWKSLTLDMKKEPYYEFKTSPKGVTVLIDAGY